MSSEHFQNIKRLFQAALKLDPRKRSGFLDEACKGDPGLRDKVERLLAQDGKGDDFLERPVVGDSPSEGIGAHLEGTRLGRYRLDRLISSGGMGSVYEARQEHPHRIVAVKVLREGIMSRSAKRRFDYEARILANLKHPGIARVIEAGTHGVGGEEAFSREISVPYFVMDYIEDARTITEYAHEKRGTLKERLTLFLQACDAVHHGHQKGIIHRDLKPGNILVDVEGKVKVIDFGVARATDSDLALTTLQTEAGQILGTLQYMSPEQLKADPHDLDIRSDVYSLGVVLYELLCGDLPYDVRKTPVHEAARRIREEEPKRPCLRNRLLKGDVETIILTAMEKDRVRRYQSVLDLASDIRRCLKGEVILAKPATRWVKIRKSIKRNPVTSSALGVAFAAVAALLISIPLYADRLADERDRAQKARKEATEGTRVAREQTRLAGARFEEILRLSDIKRFSQLEAEAEELWPARKEKTPELEAWLAKAEDLLGRLPLHARRLEALRMELDPGSESPPSPGAWRFEDHRMQWEHDILHELIEGMNRFRDKEKGMLVDVENRLRFAKTVHFESIEKQEKNWNETLAVLGDGKRAPMYGGLTLEPQLGLVPVGMDPESGLFEFAHLQTGTVPERGPDWKLRVTGETGLIFVLLPGGRYDMGASLPGPDRPSGSPNADLLAGINEGPVHGVTMPPFLISKYEMTQGQWERFTGGNPSVLRPGVEHYGERYTLLNPVENVTWSDCARVLSRLELRLPTEAEWEYAARAGTTTVWWTGDDKKSLGGVEPRLAAANLADRVSKAKRQSDDWFYEEWMNDGRYTHTPVGSYRANPFGLHDVCGNVSEWCQDTYHPDYRGAPADGSSWEDPGNSIRILRGGAFDSSAEQCRSARRIGNPEDHHAPYFGLRPALSIRR